jgi:hypothetical protein
MKKKELFKDIIKSYETIFYQDHNTIGKSEGTISKSPKKGIFEYKTTKSNEESFLENYGNPLCSVWQKNLMIVLEENNDKISLKLYESIYSRKVGIKFFGKKKNCHYLTVNKKTGDFYIGRILNYQNKRNVQKKVVKNPTNYYSMVMDQISVITLMYRNNPKTGYLKNELLKKFIDALGFENNNPVDPDKLQSYITEKLIKNSLEKKGVKLPNNFKAFLNDYGFNQIPKLKLLRKHKLRFVDAFMDHNELKGNEIKKQLHQCLRTNIHLLKNVINWFGYDKVYRSNIILDLLNKPQNEGYTSYPSDFSESEKNKFFTYFIWYLKGNIDSSTLTDHVNFYYRLKYTFGERISLDAKSINEFVNEHARWSVMISSYRQGYNVRNYDDKFIDTIQQNIFDFSGIEYVPTLLQTTDEYNDESAFQNNCVRTYIDRCTSIIVSLRNNTDERATIEYFLGYEPSSKKFKLSRVQSLGKFNQKLPESWNPVMEILDTQVNQALLNSKDFKMSIKTSYPNNKTVVKNMVIKDPKEITGNSNYIGLIQWDNVEEISNNQQYFNNYILDF